MNKQLAAAFLIPILCSVILKAQGQVTKLTTNSATESTTKSSPKPSLAVIIIILSTMFSLTFLLLCYSKFCHTSSSQPTTTTNNPQNIPITRPIRSRFSGIDPQLIKSLPFFNFSHLRGSKRGLECAVCLSKFNDSDILRLLPSCKHAFHMECIDQWLNSHSSCPLCRHKYDPSDPNNFTYSNSLRYLTSPSNLSRDVFVQREQDAEEDGDRKAMSSRGDEEQLLLFHKFNHRVIVSEVVVKNRWSDVNSLDMLSLNSEMMRVVSGSRFVSASERVYESKLSCGVEETSGSVSSSNIEIGSSVHEKVRSMSEIANFSRFKETMKEKIGEGDERTRRLWLPIARRTVQWFAGRQGGLESLRYQPETFSFALIDPPGQICSA
ncbi:Putative RING-H2 finger protein ATL12 [Linum grandiflorum]